MVDFLMPSLGADMEAGTLVEWLIKPGDWVKRGDVVAVVETQKGAIEIETFQAGLVEKILTGLNTKVPVGTPLAQIRTEAAAAPPPVPPVAPPVTPVVPPTVIVPPVSPSTPPRPPVTVVKASPAARRLAQERGIDLSMISGSGPEGAIYLFRCGAAARCGCRPAGCTGREETRNRTGPRRDESRHSRRHGAIEA